MTLDQLTQILSPKLVTLSRPFPTKTVPDELGASLSLTTWNLGYAGLGHSSDFIFDGGRKRFPPSRATVRSNLEGITATLEGIKSDVYFLQEVSVRSPISYWVRVRNRLENHFAGRHFYYRTEITTPRLPWPFKIDHGTAIIANARPAQKELIPLPLEPNWNRGLVRRNYALQVTRFPIAGQKTEWVIANLHLAAFDKGGDIRRQQAEAVFEFATAEFAQGNFVILGGDWNMRLVDTNFPNTTDPGFLSWLIDFPPNYLPRSWKIAVDPSVPTMRTLHKPYVANENYTTIIDGFIVSPNVTIDNVFGTDTGFAHTDHMPMTMRVSLNR